MSGTSCLYVRYCCPFASLTMPQNPNLTFHNDNTKNNINPPPPDNEKLLFGWVPDNNKVLSRNLPDNYLFLITNKELNSLEIPMSN